MSSVMFLWFFWATLVACVSCQSYKAGMSVKDITSVINEQMMYGYARKLQDTRGIHTRQYSRSFVISHQSEVVALVVVDSCMITHALKQEVIEKLDQKLPGIFKHDNVMLMATHSHSFPGGFHTYFLYQIPSNGFNKVIFDTMVAGIVDGIVTAYNNRKDSSLSKVSDELKGISVNRSPYAYDQNPLKDIQRYKDNVEKSFDMIKIEDTNGVTSGLLSFYGVHATSLQPHNHLISSDNLGYAALKTLKTLTKETSKSLVVAFAQSFSADSSPNINGTRCAKTNEFCSYNQSTCPEQPDNPKLCTGQGPLEDHFKSAQLIGNALANKAIDLFRQKNLWSKLSGDVRYVHQWVKMAEQEITDEDKTIKTCGPALGYAFGAGSTDGPGMPPFLQGTFDTINVIEVGTNAIFNKSQKQIDCQKPKPIFLHTYSEKPYLWQPTVLPLQMIKVGDVVFVAMPLEVTTMAGRKLRESIKKVLVLNGLPEKTKVFINSLSNAYASYLTTPEEYMVQRYEGGSTIYGKDSFNLFEYYLKSLAEALAKGVKPVEGTPPKDLRGLQEDSLEAPKYDHLKKKENYGDVLKEPLEEYKKGGVVSCTFRSGNPRNVLANEINYLEVQHKDPLTNNWSTVYSDADWETKLFWNSACHGVPGINGKCTRKVQSSDVVVEWEIPSKQQEGVYRIVHNGVAKVDEAEFLKYKGVSREFHVQ